MVRRATTHAYACHRNLRHLARLLSFAPLQFARPPRERLASIASGFAKLVAESPLARHARTRSAHTAAVVFIPRACARNRVRGRTRAHAGDTTKEVQVWSFHQLRHSFCSTLVRNGVSVEAVRVLAGHAELKTTQRYVHASAADLKAAVLTLARCRTSSLRLCALCTRRFPSLPNRRPPPSPPAACLRRQRATDGQRRQPRPLRPLLLETL